MHLVFPHFILSATWVACYLIKLKMESHELAKNELLFFEQERVLNRKYLKVLEDKEKLS